jgi:hypothetical protein
VPSGFSLIAGPDILFSIPFSNSRSKTEETALRGLKRLHFHDIYEMK